jgi:hypothetical protein
VTISSGDRIWRNGRLGTVVAVVSEAEGVVECVVESPGAPLERVRLTVEELTAALAPANDGLGDSLSAIAALWALWMRSVIPRIRQAALATRPVRPYAHQDEAVFARMLPQPRLRFLLAGFAAERAWQLERLVERLGLAVSAA